MNPSKTKILLIAALFVITASFLSTCFFTEDDTSEFRTNAQLIPRLELYSLNGQYELPQDDIFDLPCEVSVVGRDGLSLQGISVYLNYSVGASLQEGEIKTDFEGKARFFYRSFTLPGEHVITATARIDDLITISDSKVIHVYGGGPYIFIETNTDDVCTNFGSFPYKDITVRLFSHINTPISGVPLQIITDCGCFLACDPMTQFTDESGLVTFHYIQPVWGTSETDWSDFNAPRSVNIGILIPIEGWNTDYIGSFVSYVYPFHAKFWYADFDVDALNGLPIPFSIFVYWQDPNGRNCQQGINVQFSLATDGDSILLNSFSTTANGGRATTYVTNYQVGETITVTATIDERSPCPDCWDEREGWFWTDSVTMTL